MTKTKKYCLITGTTLIVVPALVILVPLWYWWWSQTPFWTTIGTCMSVGVILLIASTPEPPPLSPVRPQKACPPAQGGVEPKR